MTKEEERMDIKALSIDKEGFLSVIHDRSLVTKNGKVLSLPDTAYNGTQPVHEDLYNVLKLMVPHMLAVIELPGYKIGKPNYLTNKTALTDEKLAGYYVNGFSISDKGMLTIKGGIEAASGKKTPLNAHTFTDPDTSSYEYLENLLNLVEEAKEEAMSYFIDGKFGAGAQAELFDAVNEESN